MAAWMMVLGLFVSMAASPAAVPASGDVSSSVVALDCQAPIGFATTPPEAVTSIGGAVALQTRASSRRALQTSFDADAATSYGRYFAKTPLYVRTGGKTAQIIIPRTQIGRVAVTWGNTDHDGIAVRSFNVGPCAGSTPWIVFPGGYHVTKPACIELVVRVSGRDHRIRMGVGRPCPGQRPPVEPSDS